MSKIKFYFIVLMTTIAISSCSKSTDDPIEPPRDFATQYATESALIDTYLKTSYITVMEAPGATNDQDVTITTIPPGGTQTPIYSYLNSTTFPKLVSREVKMDGITYTLYYLVLREGSGEKPCNVDNVYTSFNGKYLYETTTDNVTSISAALFQEVIFPQGFISLYNDIRGKKEVFPQFRGGDATPNANGTVSYTNFGAGVIFIPSGLAYYNSSVSLPAYSPVVFSFKLYGVQRSDLEYNFINGVTVSDPDGVLSYQEDIDGDGYMWTKSELPDGADNPDDTDKDGIPDFLDFDDDGDGYATKGEVKDAKGLIYTFDLIPDCSGDQVTATRIKRHLDKNCTKMNQ